jgi:hypothetical protein
MILAQNMLLPRHNVRTVLVRTKDLDKKLLIISIESICNFSKKTETFASKGAPPVSLTPVGKLTSGVADMGVHLELRISPRILEKSKWRFKYYQGSGGR